VTRIKPESPVAKVIRSGKVIGLANHTVLIQRDGAEVAIEDSAAPILNRQGQIEGVVLVFHDVSEQRRTEKALRASERLATTGRLAATIAHKIHNPLDAVSNLLYLIEQATEDKALREYVSLATSELERVTQMTEQMLAFQREAVRPVPVHMSDILGSVLSLYERKLQSAAIRVDKQIEDRISVMALPGELRQVFANLIGNAIEAMRSQQGRLVLRTRTARDGRNGRHGVRILVADNGPGIPSEIRKKIFDPFFTTKGESGTGLGLWISADIVRKYEGTIRLWSSTRPGSSGTCFSVFLPFGENSAS
jgi:signal transduction histidine kinase